MVGRGLEGGRLEGQLARLAWTRCAKGQCRRSQAREPVDPIRGQREACVRGYRVREGGVLYAVLRTLRI